MFDGAIAAAGGVGARPRSHAGASRGAARRARRACAYSPWPPSCGASVWRRSRRTWRRGGARTSPGAKPASRRPGAEDKCAPACSKPRSRRSRALVALGAGGSLAPTPPPATRRRRRARGRVSPSPISHGEAADAYGASRRITRRRCDGSRRAAGAQRPRRQLWSKGRQRGGDRGGRRHARRGARRGGKRAQPAGARRRRMGYSARASAYAGRRLRAAAPRRRAGGRRALMNLARTSQAGELAGAARALARGGRKGLLLLVGGERHCAGSCADDYASTASRPRRATPLLVCRRRRRRRRRRR